MKKPININSIGEQIDLKAGKYRIDILGGWGVKLGEFSVLIKDIDTQEMIKCKRTFLPVQSFAFGKRAKRIFVISVPKSARYEVVFKNQESLKVKHSNLPISSLRTNPLSNEGLEIYFH